MEQIIGFIQTVYAFIATNLGLKSDAADSSGTVLARLKHVIDSLIPGVNTNIATLSGKLCVPTVSKIKIGSAEKSSGTGNVYTTAHSYSGSGVLHMVAQTSITKTASEAANAGSIKLTIDGTVVFDGVASISGAGTAIGNGSGNPILTMPCEFSTSILIEHKFAINTGINLLTAWNYKTT